jgi:hypothetical protein
VINGLLSSSLYLVIIIDIFYFFGISHTGCLESRYVSLQVDGYAVVAAPIGDADNGAWGGGGGGVHNCSLPTLSASLYIILDSADSDS